MKTIIVKTQVEIDDLPEKFNEFTFIEIRASQRITVYKARENSSVEAWENSSVVARENVGVHLQSDFASVILFMYSVCWVFSKKAKVEKKSDRANVIFVESLEGLDGWLEEN